MKLSGRNIRRIYSDGTSAMAFDLDMEITNVTGEASFGISGIQLGGSSDTPKSTLFNFKKIDILRTQNQLYFESCCQF